MIVKMLALRITSTLWMLGILYLLFHNGYVYSDEYKQNSLNLKAAFFTTIAKCDDYKKIDEFFESRWSELTNVSFRHDKSLLSLAASKGCIYAVEKMIAMGVDISSQNKNGSLLQSSVLPSPTKVASKELEITEIFLKNGIQPDDFGEYYVSDILGMFPARHRRKAYEARSEKVLFKQYKLLKLLHKYGFSLYTLGRRETNLLSESIYTENFFMFCYMKHNAPNLVVNKYLNKSKEYLSFIERRANKECDNYEDQ